MQLGSVGAVIPLPTAGSGESHAEGPGKFDFYCSKGHRKPCYLFIFTWNVVLPDEFLYKLKLLK